jgi:hypothetical protein
MSSSSQQNSDRQPVVSTHMQISISGDKDVDIKAIDTALPDLTETS